MVEGVSMAPSPSHRTDCPLSIPLTGHSHSTPLHAVLPLRLVGSVGQSEDSSVSIQWKRKARTPPLVDRHIQ